MKLNDRSSFVLALLVSTFVSAGVAGAQQPFPTQALTPSLDDIKNTAPFSGFGDAVAIEGRTLMVGIRGRTFRKRRRWPDRRNLRQTLR